MRALGSAIALAVAVAGCALKAPPERPVLPNLKVPEAWATQGAPAGAVGGKWLAAFSDSQLEALVREALAKRVLASYGRSSSVHFPKARPADGYRQSRTSLPNVPPSSSRV